MVAATTRKSHAAGDGAADRRVLAGLEHAQQLDLQRGRHVGRPRRGRACRRRPLELAGALLGGAGEGAAQVAEELGLEQALGQGAAVDRERTARGAARCARAARARSAPCPCPVSPVTRTVASVSATRSSVSMARRKAGWLPTRRAGVALAAMGLLGLPGDHRSAMTSGVIFRKSSAAHSPSMK